MLRRAFTLVELMVAVVVLLAVIIATSKIFSTASRVTSMGEASSDVLQQAGVIEGQLRRDMESVTQDGYIAIQCVAVANDVNSYLNFPGTPYQNGQPRAPLLNPALDPTAVIRVDSIVFFKAGGETSMRWSGPNDTTTYGGGQQSRAVRVFYGHGVQLPGLGNDPANTGSPAKPIIQGVDPTPGSGTPQILPWTWWDPQTARQLRWSWGGLVNQTSAGVPKINPNQPGAQEWVLCRKATLLADDLGSDLYFPDPAIASTLGPSATPSVFGDSSISAPVGTDSAWRYWELRGRDSVLISSNIIPSPMMQSGWVDIASSELATIRKFIAPTLNLPVDSSGNPTIVFPPSGGPTQYGVYSVTPPWVSQPIANAPFNFPPMGWPVGSDAATWPSGATVASPSINASTPLGTGFTSQRDRIARGTFGPLHRNDVTMSSGAYLNVGLLTWPRAEKSVPNLDRRSEILVTPVLSNNCSSFQIDWTWERGTGRQTDAVGALLGAFDHLRYGSGGTVSAAIMRGYEPDVTSWDSSVNDFVRSPRPQPWFGFPDTGDGVVGSGGVIPHSWQRLGVTLAQDLASMPAVQEPGNPANVSNDHMRRIALGIEGFPGDPRVPAISNPFGAGVPVRVYTAIFGFNQGEAYTVTPDGWRVLRDDYTPWPSQLRFTLTLHDPRLVLDRGREFQFVVDLPKRKK